MAFPEADLSRHQRLLLCLLLAAAFALRAWRIDLVLFQIDEAIAAAVASRIGREGFLPLAGIRTSFGFQNPPLLLYLIAPFFQLSRDPVVVSLFFSLLGTAAVWMAWRTGLLAGGAPTAWLAAVILAAAPNAVEHSRRLWGHDLQVFLAAAALHGAVAAWKSGRPVPLGLSLLAAGAAQAVHLSGVILWLPGIAVLALRPIRGKAMAILIGAGGTLLIYAPWLAREAMEGFGDLRLMVSLLLEGSAGRDLGLPVSPLAAWTLLLADFWTNDALGAPRPWMLSPRAAWLTLLQTPLSLALLAAALAGACLLPARLRNDDGERLLPLLFLLPVLASLLLLVVLIRASVPAYHLPAVAPAALLSAFVLGRVIGEGARLRRVVLGLLGIWCLASAGLALEIRHQIALGAGSNIPLAERKEVVRIMARLNDGGSYFVHQDARRIATGIDVAYTYLLYWGGIYENVEPDPLAADHLFVILDHSSRIHPAMDAFLHGLPKVDFPRQTLFLIPREERPSWLLILERYPPGWR